MTDIAEFLFGYRQVEIASKKTPAEAAKVLKTLHRPRKDFQDVDTIADINQASEPYQIRIFKQRYFKYFGFPSVVFAGVLEADSKGMTVLRGQIQFALWYYGSIGLILLLASIWGLANPAYGIFALIFIMIMIFLVRRFARSDKENLSREIEYAAS